MKRVIKNTGKVLLTLVFLSVSVLGNAQEKSMDKRIKKEKRKAELKANYAALDSMLENRSFVLEAYYLANKYGNFRIPVSPNVNFIRVNSQKGVLQTGVNSDLGYNGVGGVTAEGNISGWKIEKDSKRLSHFLRFNIHTAIGTYDIALSVTADNHARAVISGLGPGQLIYEGQLETPDPPEFTKDTELSDMFHGGRLAQICSWRGFVAGPDLRSVPIPLAQLARIANQGCSEE